jgi:hypothetical protein
MTNFGKRVPAIGGVKGSYSCGGKTDGKTP